MIAVVLRYLSNGSIEPVIVDVSQTHEIEPLTNDSLPEPVQIPIVEKIIDYENTYVHTKRWLDVDFTEYIDDFNTKLLRFGSGLSILYRNMESGFEYIYNPSARFFSASVPKAVYALYIYLKAENSEIDLEEYLTYTEDDFFGGSGLIIQNHHVGARFTQRELLRLNISYSDNIATLMLRRKHGLSGYREFITGIGGSTRNIGGNIFDSHITATEAGIFAQEIYHYIESDRTYSREFKEHLLDNQYKFIVSDYPVASKSGWTRGIAWHDMAIVYAPSPYTLTILSRREGWTRQDYEDFREISMMFQEFNAMWFD
jgi:beta-lactamase class A